MSSVVYCYHIDIVDIAGCRFSKAKVSLLTKQVQDGIDLRNKLEEQVRDLQRQLNQAREDNRHTNKRYHIILIFRFKPVKSFFSLSLPLSLSLSLSSIKLLTSRLLYPIEFSS